MTPSTQDDLAAGRELDAEVAEKIMGWQPWPLDTHLGQIAPLRNPATGEINPPAYSTEISAAWQIVEWAEASPRGWKLTLMRSGRSLPDYVWICTFHRGHVELARVVERDVPLAICKAALQAVSG